MKIDEVEAVSREQTGRVVGHLHVLVPTTHDRSHVQVAT